MKFSYVPVHTVESKPSHSSRHDHYLNFTILGVSSFAIGYVCVNVCVYYFNAISYTP
jgi:hypothetical protein